MLTVQRELDRVLTLLRNKIRERGFTQLEVQQALSWGRSYISQLLTKQKSLRFEQVLLILNVIGVDPEEFFGELYDFPQGGEARERDFAPAAGAGPAPSSGGPSEELLINFQELQALLKGLVWLLTEKSLIDVEDLADAVDPAGRAGGYPA